MDEVGSLEYDSVHNTRLSLPVSPNINIKSGMSPFEIGKAENPFSVEEEESNKTQEMYDD